MALAAATRRMPPVTARGTWATSGAAPTTTAATAAPATTSDHRERAPARTLRAVACTEPPTGPPPKKLPAMLAAP